MHMIHIRYIHVHIYVYTVHIYIYIYVHMYLHYIYIYVIKYVCVGTSLFRPKGLAIGLREAAERMLLEVGRLADAEGGTWRASFV